MGKRTWYTQQQKRTRRALPACRMSGVRSRHDRSIGRKGEEVSKCVVCARTAANIWCRTRRGCSLAASVQIACKHAAPAWARRSGRCLPVSFQRCLHSACNMTTCCPKTRRVIPRTTVRRTIRAINLDACARVQKGLQARQPRKSKCRAAVKRSITGRPRRRTGMFSRIRIVAAARAR